MPAISSRADPSTVADASSNPAVNTTPTPTREGERVKQFALRLKADAQWMKQFLHGNK
jgi:hypothetical protein